MIFSKLLGVVTNRHNYEQQKFAHTDMTMFHVAVTVMERLRIL